MLKNKKLNKKVSILKVGDNAKNIDSQLQMPKIPIVEDKSFKELEEWVVVSVLNLRPGPTVEPDTICNPVWVFRKKSLFKNLIKPGKPLKFGIRLPVKPSVPL